MDMNMAIKVGAMMQSCLKPVSTLKGDVTKPPLPSTVAVMPILQDLQLLVWASKFEKGTPEDSPVHRVKFFVRSVKAMYSDKCYSPNFSCI